VVVEADAGADAEAESGVESMAGTQVNPVTVEFSFGEERGASVAGVSGSSESRVGDNDVDAKSATKAESNCDADTNVEVDEDAELKASVRDGVDARGGEVVAGGNGKFDTVTEGGCSGG
jgi:hypothetical protein